MKKLLVICGPAGSGKTMLAQALAEGFGVGHCVLTTIEKMDMPQKMVGGYMIDGVTSEHLRYLDIFVSMLWGNTLIPCVIAFTQHVPDAAEIEMYRETRVYYVLNKAMPTDFVGGYSAGAGEQGRPG